MTREAGLARSRPAPGAATDRDDGLTSPAVVTAFAILDLLAGRDTPARLAEVVAALSLPKTSALRVLRTLVSLDVVRRDAATGGYRIGPRLGDYAHVPDGQESLLVREFPDAARPLQEHLDETVQLAVLTGTTVTFVAKLDTSRPVRLVTYVGRQLPAHASASGKAILAHVGPSALRAVLDTGLPRVGPRTITEQAEFLAALDRVRRDGYAAEIEESAADLRCFSAPVFDAAGIVRAAFTVCVATVHIPEDRCQVLIDSVRAGALHLSQALGAATTKEGTST
ncbi:MAG TPA: IclR family transcriptional regulator [Trebonia sp.]|nr:IclR family transcriptional regulator [Trebonia sp.]